MCTPTPAMVHTWRLSEDNYRQSILSFCYVGPGNLTQVIRHGGKGGPWIFYIVEEDLELTTLLPLSSERWGCRCKLCPLVTKVNSWLFKHKKTFINSLCGLWYSSVVEHLPGIHNVLSSNHSNAKINNDSWKFKQKQNKTTNNLVCYDQEFQVMVVELPVLNHSWIPGVNTI